MDGREPLTGTTEVVEVEFTSDATCLSSVALLQTNGGGEVVIPGELNFGDREPGTGSATTGFAIYWSTIEEDGEGHEWTGTYIIRSWSDALVEIALTGTDCHALSGEIASCDPADGELSIEGERRTYSPSTGTLGHYTDADTAEGLCSSSRY